MTSRINWKITAVLVALCLFGLALRLLPTLSSNIHFSFDQGLDMLMVKQLVVDHKINLISRYSGLQGVLMGPLWTWIMAIPFALSHGDPVANVIFFSLISIFGSLAVFFLFRKIVGVRGAFMLFVMTLVSPNFVSNTRTILSPHILIYAFPLYLFFCYQLFVEKKAKYWIPLLFITAVFFQFEIAFAIFTIPPIIICLVVFNAWRTLRSKYFLFGSILGAVTFVPQIVFDLRHDFLITKSLIGFAGGSNNSLYSEPLPLSLRIAARWKTFIEDFWGMTLFLRPLLLQIFVLLSMFTGIIKLSLDKREVKSWNLLKICLIILVSFYGGFLLYPGAIWGWYRAGLPIVFLTLLTIPLAYLTKTNKLAKVVVAIFVVFVVYQNIPVTEIKRSWQGNVGGVATLKTQREILDHIYKTAGDRTFSYYIYTPPVYDYIWQYNFWSYGQTKYNRLPSNWTNSIPPLNIGSLAPPPSTNQGLFFLIIEPDTDRPWAPNGWLENYIKVGRVISRKVFPGNVVVEERIAIDVKNQ